MPHVFSVICIVSGSIIVESSPFIP